MSDIHSHTRKHTTEWSPDNLDIEIQDAHWRWEVGEERSLDRADHLANALKSWLEPRGLFWHSFLTCRKCAKIVHVDAALTCMHTYVFNSIQACVHSTSTKSKAKSATHENVLPEEPHPSVAVHAQKKGVRQDDCFLLHPLCLRALSHSASCHLKRMEAKLKELRGLSI